MAGSGRGAAAGRLVGVGVGPGDPELLTLKALRAVREADRVVAPCVAIDAPGRAETIVRQAAPEVRVERLAFAMSGERGESQAAAATRLLPCLDAGETVAFVTLGDPNTYSTFSPVAAEVRALRPGVQIATVAGIMAFQDLAARSGSVLLEGTQSLSLVTALAGPAPLEDALSTPGRAIVVYKGGRHFPQIAEALARSGRLEKAVAGELLGLPGERVGPLSELCGAPATYLATVIVPPAAPA